MTRRNRTLPAKRADEWRPLFLRTLRQSANVRAACEAAGISRAAAYKSRETSPAFAAEWDTAVQEAVDGLELAAWARARKSSDGLLLALLKAHRPALYRETTRTEHAAAEGTTGFAFIFTERPTPDTGGTPPAAAGVPAE